MCQAEDGIRYLVRSRGLGDVYKRQDLGGAAAGQRHAVEFVATGCPVVGQEDDAAAVGACLLYTSDAADERSSVDLVGRRIIKKKTTRHRQRRG